MSKLTFIKAVFSAVISVLFISPVLVSAQALEEIVVTAQRRAQTLQEVPISVEAFTGVELQQQGYRDLNALSAFSASINVDQESVIGPALAIRGFGTTGNTVTLESATPIFVDGIHYNRASMVKNAFMDVEQVEVLKGPQPVYFGQNAVAGAFNITSRMPSDVWEGNLDIEFGTRNTQEVNAGIGGPINDQWRMRIAGKYEDTAGHMNEVVSGSKIGAYENYGGRLITQWLPNDQLTITSKLDASIIRKDVETNHICLTGGPLVYGRDDPGVPGDIGNERSVWADPPKGEGWNVPLAIELDNDCFGSRNAASAGGPYYQPPDYIREENSVFGSVDVREAAQGFAEIDNEGIAGYEDIDTYTAALRFDYEFGNGILADWNTAYVRYLRNYVRDNSYSNFFMNFQGREEDFDQWSTELRLNSPTGGPIEWVVSGFYQKNSLNVFSSSLRANVRRAQRYNVLWESQEWLSGSGVFTFNFLDDRASIDVGGRIAKLKKNTFADGYAAQWVFDVGPPCDADSIDTSNPTAAEIASCTGLHSNAVGPLDPSEVRILVDGPVDTTNLWTTVYNGGGDQREVPPNWLPSQARAVGLTNPDYLTRRNAENRGPGDLDEEQCIDVCNANGALVGDFSNTEFDPQVTLRYRPTDAISLYARWAQSSKAGGFDTGQTSLNPDGYFFEPESAETWEIGSKGTFLDGRGRFDLTLFTLEFQDLQISVATNDVDDPFININAGSQRVRGLEFDLAFAATDQLRLALGGAILDGEFTNFPNSTCTQVEFRDADSNDCFSAAEAAAAGNPELEGLIDRTGQQTPRTPDWKFIFNVDYWIPLFDAYKATFNAKAYYSDGYITDFSGFSDTVSYDKHGDLNLLVGFGDMDDTWSISLYGRNLLEARPTYHPESDLEPDGILTSGLSPNSFASYGVKLQYNFR